jgi:hypothetical protein
MRSSHYYGSHRNVGNIKRFVYIYAIWLRKFTILILKSNQLVIEIAGAVVNVNAIRIISNTLPQFGEIIDTSHQQH